MATPTNMVIESPVAQSGAEMPRERSDQHCHPERSALSERSESKGAESKDAQ
jgi:hypothetical protein